MKPTAFIFDVDGTLANVESIRHYVINEPKNFDLFHELSVDVPAHEHVVAMAHEAKNNGHAIIIVTARMAMWRNHTAMWLALNDIPSDAMYMRKDKDGREDFVVKQEILNKILRTYNVIHAVDDNPSVIELWKQNNIPTTIIEGWIQ